MKNTQHNLLKTLLVILMLGFSQSIIGQVDILRDNQLVKKGEQVCIDHVVEGWDDLISATFGVSWDPTILQFDGVSNLDPILNATNFNSDESADGKLFFLWENPGAGQTLGDGQVLFTVCFTAIAEPDEESKIQIIGTENDPPIEFLNSNFETVSLGRAFDSFVTIELENIPEDALILYYDDIVVQVGEPICVPIRVRNFTDIFNVSFSMDFNTVRFDYTGRTFAETLNGAWQVNNKESTATQIQYSGFDSFSDTGITMDDGSRLIEICFDQTSQSSCVNEELLLSPNPLPIDAQRILADGSEVEIAVVLVPGKIKVFTPIEYNGEVIIPATCAQPNSGEISVEVSAGTDQIKYLWSNGETTSTISNLAAGTYDVSISDVCLAVDTIFRSYVVPIDGIPTADAGDDVDFNCSVDQVILDGTGSSSGTNISYLWRVLEGQLITTNTSTSTAEATEAGRYELLITNTDTGCEARDTVVVTDSRDEIAVMVSEDVALQCDDVSIRIFGNGPSADNYASSWSTDDGNILNEISPGEIEINRPGTYTFQVSNTDTGCSESEDIVVSGDNVRPDVDINGPVSIFCNEPEMNLDANLVAVSGVSYAWTTTDGSIVSGANELTVTVDAPGIYRVTATNDASGCIASDEQEVIDGRTMPNASAGADRMIGCDDENIVLQGSGSTGAQYTYNWTTADGNIVQQMANGEAVINIGGTYTFTVVETSNGCSTSSDVNVTGDNNRPLASISGASVLDCNNPTIELNANSGGVAVAGYTYSWNTTDGAFLSGADQVTAEVDQPGTYMVEVINDATGCMNSAMVSITADRTDPVITTSADDAIDCSTEVKTLTATSDNMTNMTFQWTALDGNGQILSSSSIAAIEVQGADRYEVLVTNPLTGCASTATTVISLNGTLEEAQVGMDYDHCESETLLMGNMGGNATGLWTVIAGGAVLEDPMDPNCRVNSLSGGVNTFVWTLSTTGCPDYSNDTIHINYTPVPIAVDDNYDVVQGFGTVDIDLLANDQYMTESGATIMLTSRPSQGTLTENGNGQYTYTLDDPNVFGVFTFQYEICDDLCSLNCDTGTVTIDVRDGSIPPIDPADLKKPQSLGITPNGDGLNDQLVFDELLVGGTDFKTKRLLVYNRWGDIVHESMPYNNDWGGTDSKGGLLPQGTYYFVMQLDIGQGAIIEGDVTILQ